MRAPRQEFNLAISDLARLIGDWPAWEHAVGTCEEKHAKAGAENCRAAKEGGGVETPPSARKGRDEKDKGGKSGSKRPQG